MSERILIAIHRRREHLPFSHDSPLTLICSSSHQPFLCMIVVNVFCLVQSHSEEAVRAAASVSLVTRRLNGKNWARCLVVTQQPWQQDELRRRSLLIG